MSSPSNDRKKLRLRSPVTVDIGCNCRKTKLISSIFSHLKPKPKPTTNYNSSTSTTTTAFTSSSHNQSFTSIYEDSSNASPPHFTKERHRRRRRKRGSKVTRESVAVVKETLEPYEEFKESMVQMIVESEIYGWDDLNDLLHRFLSLNSPRHHHHILQAFADIWNGAFV